MNTDQLRKPLEIWVKEDLFLPKISLIPLLMHTTSLDTKTDPVFGNSLPESWNLLRESLKGMVTVRQFKKLTDAGCLVVTPHTLQDYLKTGLFNSACQLYRKAVASGRTPIIFPGGIEYRAKPGEFVFATSVYRDSSTATEISTPAWLYDLGAKVSPIPKPSFPTVGFVGATQYPGRLNQLLENMPKSDIILRSLAGNALFNRTAYLGARLPVARAFRKHTLKETLKSPELKTDFLERNTNYFIQSQEYKKRAKDEYIENIEKNAYTLCLRGSENFSYRLYEVMSAGRIPIIIDTNMRLPELESLNWEDFSVIVPYAEVGKIGKIVAAFHDRLSDDDFAEVCRKSRAAFEELLPHNFILKFVKYLQIHQTISHSLPDRNLSFDFGQTPHG